MNCQLSTVYRNTHSTEGAGSSVCTIQEQIKDELEKDDTGKGVIKYLANPTEHQLPKLPNKGNIDNYEIYNGLLYRNTETRGKGISRGKVKQLVIPHAVVA